jgi:hypothetical protein
MQLKKVKKINSETIAGAALLFSAGRVGGPHAARAVGEWRARKRVAGPVRGRSVRGLHRYYIFVFQLLSIQFFSCTRCRPARRTGDDSTTTSREGKQPLGPGALPAHHDWLNPNLATECR